MRLAWETILSTVPGNEEIRACLTSIEETRAALPKREDATFRARANIVHVLLNHNDFITIR